jgi:hypothetical protein
VVNGRLKKFRGQSTISKIFKFGMTNDKIGESPGYNTSPGINDKNDSPDIPQEINNKDYLRNLHQLDLNAFKVRRVSIQLNAAELKESSIKEGS